MKPFFCLILAAALLAGCSDDMDTILKDQYRVSGTITDSVTHQPLAGVQVSLLEDREPLLFGGTLLHQLTTDQSGTYSMNFKWKDSPYEVYVHKPGYFYQRLITNLITNDTLRVSYQNVEFGQHESRLDFKMVLTDHLRVKVRNVEPLLGDDQLILQVKKTRHGPAFLGPLYETGVVDRDYYLGLQTPGTYVYLDYSVRQQGVTTQHLDSVLVEANTLKHVELNL